MCEERRHLPTLDGEDGTKLRRGASMVVLHRDNVLLVLRGKEPFRGLWSLPGGMLNKGEAARAAALREVLEETGVEAAIEGPLGRHRPPADPSSFPFGVAVEIEVFYGTSAGSTPVAADDAEAAEWVALVDLGNYALTQGAREFILEAAALLADKNRPAQQLKEPR
jgi:8-oxo-dGTP diphosphatase